MVKYICGVDIMFKKVTILDEKEKSLRKKSIPFEVNVFTLLTCILVL